MKKLLLLLTSLLASCSTVKEAEDCSKIPQSVIKNSCVAIKDNPTPLVGVLRAWVDESNLWRPDETDYVNLTVSFLDGTNKQKEMAWKRFQLVDNYAEGLNVTRVESNGDIRVSFAGQGHWSYLGRVAKKIPKNQQTLNISLASNDTWVEWDRVAIHEFLHALGFEHEHQHPNNIIPWNKDRVYAVYKQQQGWSKEEIDFQVLNRGNPVKLRTNGFHDDSIMMYPVDPSLTTNGYSVGWNTKITECDIQLLKELYPAP